MKKEVIYTNEAPQAVGPYSQGISLSGQKELIYFSGQIAIDPFSAKLVDGDAVAQTKQILKNITALLKSRDLTANNIVKTTIFMTDLLAFKDVNAVYGAFFEKDYPARSCVEVSKLPLNASVEIEIICAK